MKTLINFFLFLPLILLSGCFEIIEEVDLNSNGSGNLTLTINGNQSKDQLDKAMTKDSIYNFKIPKRKDIDLAITDVVTKIKSIKGISNVTVSRDYQTYILIIKCSFENTQSLNAAINNIWLLYDKKAPTDKSYFKFNQNTFKRSFDVDLKNIKGKLGPQVKEILSNSIYTMVYRFQSEIGSFTNKNATLSKSKKAIILKNNILDVLQANKSIENEIKLK